MIQYNFAALVAIIRTNLVRFTTYTKGTVCDFAVSINLDTKRVEDVFHSETFPCPEFFTSELRIAH